MGDKAGPRQKMRDKVQLSEELVKEPQCTRNGPAVLGSQLVH